MTCYHPGCTERVLSHALKRHGILTSGAQWEKHHRLNTICRGRKPGKRSVECTACGTMHVVSSRSVWDLMLSCRNKMCDAHVVVRSTSPRAQAAGRLIKAACPSCQHTRAVSLGGPNGRLRAPRSGCLGNGNGNGNGNGTSDARDWVTIRCERTACAAAFEIPANPAVMLGKRLVCCARCKALNLAPRSHEWVAVACRACDTICHVKPDAGEGGLGEDAAAAAEVLQMLQSVQWGSARNWLLRC